MELRVLGAHNMESKETRMESHLIDGVLLLDAGGPTRALTFQEQRGIRAIILSHRHFDHVRDLLPLGATRRDTDVTLEVFAIKDTVDFLQTRLRADPFPDLLRKPSPENPALRLNVVEFYKEFKVLDYIAVAVPVPHSVPAAGFQVSSGDVKLFYTGDTGRGLSDAWKHVSPSVLLTEVTFGNENQARADQVGHMTPSGLAEVLTSFKKERGYMPRVIVSHINPPWESKVREELEVLPAQLGVEIVVSHADMTIQL